MDTYGDLVTNLLCFFVLLFSMSSIDAAKWAELVTSFSGTPPIMAPLSPTTGGPMDDYMSSFPSMAPAPSITPKPTPDPSMTLEEWMSMQAFDDLYERIVAYVQYKDLEMFVEVTREQNTIRMRFTDSLLFDSGRANIKPAGAELLEAIIPIMRDSEESIQLIRVDGHTDNVPIHSAAFPSNWELSTMRATTVTRYMIETGGINPSLLASAGWGEYQPIDTNDTEEGKARNRRVEITIERKVESTDYAPDAAVLVDTPTPTPAQTSGLDAIGSVIPTLDPTN